MQYGKASHCAATSVVILDLAMDSVEPIFNPDRVAKTSEFTAMTWWIQTLMGFLHVFLIV